MDDIFKSIKAFLYERTVSPLFGAFALSWGVCNYRVLIIIFSESSFSDKLTALNIYFSSIDINLFEISLSLSGGLVHGVIFPSTVTVLYIFAYPVLAAPVYEYSLKKQKEIREIKQTAEGERLLSVSESRKLFNQLSKLQENHASERERYDKQIRSLTETINELENTNNESNSEDVNKLRIELEKEKDSKFKIENSLSEKDEIIKHLNVSAETQKQKIEKLNNKNKALLNDSIAQKKVKKEFKDPDLTSDEIEQLMFVGDLGRDVRADETITMSPFKEIVAKKLMQQLKRKGYIHYYDDEHGNQDNIVIISEGGIAKLLSFDNYAKRKTEPEKDIPF